MLVEGLKKRSSPSTDPDPSTTRSSPRAADGARTHDLLLTKEVLYQLSYSSDLDTEGRHSQLSGA